jgi:hypothetical protein
MRRLKAAVALLGYFAYMFVGAVICGLIWSQVGTVAFWLVFFAYAFGGVWLVLRFTRALP